MICMIRVHVYIKIYPLSRVFSFSMLELTLSLSSWLHFRIPATLGMFLFNTGPRKMHSSNKNT